MVMLTENTVDNVLRRHKELKRVKTPYLDQFQLIGDYVHIRKQNFTEVNEPGAFLTREIFDTTAPKALKIAASSLLAMLWPQGSTKRIRIKKPRRLRQTVENKRYYEFVSDTVIGVLDNPQGGLPTSLNEYMLDQLSFGTSGISVLPDPETKVAYKSWGVKHISVAEGKNGFIDTVYIELEMAVGQLVKEYGLKKVSEKVREAFNDGKFDKKEKIVIGIEPRLTRVIRNKSNRNKPFQAVHIEVKQKHMLQERGFDEMPIKVSRFWKLDRQAYGHSPTMDALPGILEANTVWEAVTIAIEKILDPPLGILDDGSLGGGDIDTSAGAITVLNSTGRAGDKNPVFPLFTVGEIRQAANLIEELKKDTSDHFFIDRLLDFNNESQMTLGEAQIRDRLRNATLQSVFVGQIAETFNPVVGRTFNILLDQGELGVIRGSIDEQIARDVEGREPMIIPDDVAELMLSGQDVFEIEYFTPAMRIMQAEEAEGHIRAFQHAATVAQLQPEVVDVLDGDESVKRFTTIVGPSEIIRSDDAIQGRRDDRAQRQQEEQQALAAQATAEAIRNVGQSGLVRLPQEAA